MPNPSTPFVVTGYVYDTNESSLLTSGEVHLRNMTTDEYITEQVSPSGDYSIDAGSLLQGYSVGDVIQVEVITSDGKLGFFRHTIASSDYGAVDKNIYVQYLTDFQRLLNDYGQNVTISQLTVTVDTRGNSSESFVDYTIVGIPTIISDISDEFVEGVLNLGDLIVFVSYNDTNKQFAVVDNRIIFDSGQYKIKSVIKETNLMAGCKYSHYELFCKKIDRTS